MKTNVADTSLIAYTKIQPKTNRKQTAILCFFQQHPGQNFTNAEIADKIGWTINNVTPRMYELRGCDTRFPELCLNPLIVKASRRVCTVTQNIANSWKLKR